MSSPAVAASPAGFSAIVAALGSSALVACITLFFSELLRVASAELRERVYAPRVTRRLMKRPEQARPLTQHAACAFSAAEHVSARPRPAAHAWPR